MLAVRPESFSKSFSAWSRGASVKPPAAAPHNTPHDGTSSLSVTQPPAAGAACAAVVPASAVVAPMAMAASTVIDFLRRIWFPPACPAVVGRACREDSGLRGAGPGPEQVPPGCGRSERRDLRISPLENLAIQVLPDTKRVGAEPGTHPYGQAAARFTAVAGLPST